MANRPRHLYLVPPLPPESETCSDCNGSGVIDDELCPLCKGRTPAITERNLRLLDAYTKERE